MQSARGFEYGVKHIISPPSGPEVKKLSDILAQVLDFDLSTTQELLNLGAIYINNVRSFSDEVIPDNTYLRVHSKPRRFPKNDGQWGQRIVFQNEHFVIVEKTSGLPVHASVDNIQENLLAYLQNELQQSLYITHRLDVPTSGLIVYAKTKEFQSAFNKILISREVKKIYKAKVLRSPGLGILRHFMENSPRAPKKVDKAEHPGWQECVLEILSETKLDDSTIELRIQLHTGRTHQIRAQLGFENCAIIGDHAYGADKIWEEEKIELQACELVFTNPLSGDVHHFIL
jgi:23S rRNA pseudouridine1911/1915/1917 synthase